MNKDDVKQVCKAMIESLNNDSCHIPCSANKCSYAEKYDVNCPISIAKKLLKEIEG